MSYSGLFYAFRRVVQFHMDFDLYVSYDRVLPSAQESLEQAGKTVNGTDLRELRVRLLVEEVQEYLAAERKDDYAKIADGLADIMVIALGTAASYGIPIHIIFDEVMRTNENKLGPDRKPIYRDDGKLLKPDGWKGPEIERLLAYYKGLVYTKPPIGSHLDQSSQTESPDQDSQK